DVFPGTTGLALCIAQISAPVCGGMSISRRAKGDSGGCGDLSGPGLHAEHPVVAVVHDARHLAAPAAHEGAPFVVVGPRALHVVEGPPDQIRGRGGELAVWTPHRSGSGSSGPSKGVVGGTHGRL